MLEEMNRRLQFLEEKFSYQERTIDALNDVIIDHQSQLDLLREQLRELRELLAGTRQHPHFEGNPPPHY